jgi:TatD DNase family protein
MSGTMPAGPRLRFIDIGINLTDPVFRGKYRGKQMHVDDFDAVLARGKKAGMTTMLITGTNLSESREAVAMARKYGLYCTVGCHPTRCNEFLTKAASPEAYYAALDKLITENRDVVRAVGECGLDYDRTHFCPADVQRRFFPLHFQLAAKHQLPMFLHNRNTGEDFSAVMREHADIVSQCSGVVHSFTGDVGELRALLKLGLYIGVNGCSLKTDENLRAVSEIPLDRLMLETDGPWCELRPTHASHALRWPRAPTTVPAAAAGPPGAAVVGSSKKKQQQPAPKKGQAVTQAASTDPRVAKFSALATDLLPLAVETVKGPEKFKPGCTVRGRCEPCNITDVFEVVYALRASEVEGPVQLADLVHATTERVFRLAPAAAPAKQ